MPPSTSSSVRIERQGRVRGPVEGPARLGELAGVGLRLAEGDKKLAMAMLIALAELQRLQRPLVELRRLLMAELRASALRAARTA